MWGVTATEYETVVFCIFRCFFYEAIIFGLVTIYLDLVAFVAQ